MRLERHAEEPPENHGTRPRLFIGGSHGAGDISQGPIFGFHVEQRIGTWKSTCERPKREEGKRPVRPCRGQLRVFSVTQYDLLDPFFRTRSKKSWVRLHAQRRDTIGSLDVTARWAVSADISGMWPDGPPLPSGRYPCRRACE